MDMTLEEEQDYYYNLSVQEDIDKICKKEKEQKEKEQMEKEQMEKEKHDKERQAQEDLKDIKPTREELRQIRIKLFS